MRLSLRFIGWFFVANAILFFLISFRYLAEILPFAMSFPTLANELRVGVFVAFTMIGHLSLLAFLPALIALPFAFFIRKIRWIQAICVLLGSFSLMLLIIDTFVFKQFHYHLNGIILQMVFAKEFHEIFELSSFEWFLVTALFFAIILLQSLMAYGVIKLIRKKPYLHGKTVGITLATCLLFSYEIFFLGGMYPALSLTQQARAFPLFNNILAAMVPLPNSLGRIETLASGNFVQPKQVVKPVHYPLNTLHFNPPSHPLNIVMIVIDTWRFDMYNADVMPNVNRFINRTWQFTNHWSGGNSTQAGVFSLFYGLPGTYWTSMLTKRQGPLLLNTLLHNGYQTAVYASAELTLPALNKTVFTDIPNLAIRTPGKTPYIQDQAITQKFLHFIDQTKNKKTPFFSFLFYNGAHAYCMDGNPIQKFQPAVTVCRHYELTNQSDPLPYLNRYKNALFFVDQQIGAVLNKIEKEGLFKNTVVILTGDHGQEFNDNHHGYWEHASNYTRYQVQTPLFIYWPNKKPAKFNQWTSHFDIAPTLMEKVLGCLNSPKDFCVGHSLLDKKSPRYLVISSYIDFGVVEPDQITTVYPTGNYAIYDKQNGLLMNAPLRLGTLRQAMLDMNRFYAGASG